MLRLGFTKDDLITMPYSKAAWYVQAASDQQEDDGGGARDATQADINAF